MKNQNYIILFFSLLFFSCEPFVTEFNNLENAVMYESVDKTDSLDPTSLKVMTWNIRFGAGRIPWKYDSCGDRVLLTEDEVDNNLDNIVDFINEELPDIIILQEVDVLSKRTSYVDQVQYILDNTHFNYGAYASMWQAQFIPNDGLGMVDVGNAILSRWEIENAERIQLPLRSDQSSIEQYFYLRRNILKTKINININSSFYVVGTHTTAFATDDTKQKHIDKFFDVLSSIEEDAIFISGGDLNALTPNAPKRDFCEEDKCHNDFCDNDYDNNQIYQASYFNHLENEENLLLPLYENFYSAFDDALVDDYTNFTHSTWNEDEDNPGSTDSEYWDRKLDYLFSSEPLTNGRTHQEQYMLSDHAPVSAIMEIR